MDTLKRQISSLKPGEYVKAIGIYDVLSSTISNLSGFENLWLSSFSFSASSGYPDLNLISLDEVVYLCQKIKSKIDCNLIVDIETGYGNEYNAYRMVKEFRSVGVNHYCIEDTKFPKESSLYFSKKNEMEDLKLQCKKIEAIKKGGSDMTYIIARTEAYNNGFTTDEAIKRCKAYVDSGADAILIHSNLTTANHLFDFSDKWNLDIPLVAVPTTYEIEFDELAQVGYKLIIMANQLIRAVVTSLELLMSQMKDCSNLKEINKGILGIDVLSIYTSLSEYKSLK